MRLFIFDTNVWLGLYMLHPDIIAKLVKGFGDNKGKIWIPEQVAWEFNNHVSSKRKSACNKVSSISSEARTNINETKNKINQNLIELRNKGLITDQKFIDAVNNDLLMVKNNIEAQLKEVDETFKEDMKIIHDGNDVIKKLVDDICATNPPYKRTTVQRIALYEEGELRVKHQVPPGLTDTNKEDGDFITQERRRYGDFLIWHDIIKKANELTRLLAQDEVLEVVFVEEEKKRDWWIARGKPEISPVLKEEFESEVGNAEIIMIPFVKLIEEYRTDFNIDKKTADEIEGKLNYYRCVRKEVYSKRKEIVAESLNNYFNGNKSNFEMLFKKDVAITDILNRSPEYAYTMSFECKDDNGIHIFEDDDNLNLIGTAKFVFEASISNTIEDIDNKTEEVVGNFNIQILVDYSKGYSKLEYSVGSMLVNIHHGEKRSFRAPDVVYNVFSRDNFTCQNCGLRDTTGRRLAISHIIPRKYGGTDSIDNLETLCRSCNALISDRLRIDYGEPYTVCPDCGCPINHENDGENGFCIDCADRH